MSADDAIIAAHHQEITMSSTINRIRLGAVAVAIACAFATPAIAHAQNQAIVLKPQSPPPAPERQAPGVEKNLKVFDELDFDVFSNQKWDRLQESHAKDIVVTWPDGHETKGIQKHIDDLKAMFVYAPDIQIKVHPIRFGSGTWTTVSGVMTGTFTRPMPADGEALCPPDGNRCALDQRDDGPRVALLGQPGVHEAARARQVIR